MKNTIRFTAIFFQVITLSALTAHLLEMPAKLKLTMDGYQLVQSIYRGWAWLGIFEIGAILFSVTWLIIDRKKNLSKKLLVAACLLFAISLMIFFMYTLPANNATQNWTIMPEDWEALRQDWEYSHAARAVLNLTGLSMQVFILLHKRRSSYHRKMTSRIIPASAHDY